MKKQTLLILTVTILSFCCNFLNAQESVTLTGVTPLKLTSTGTGTYNQTVLYHNITNGFHLELAKHTNSNNSNPIDFNINTRGATHPFFTIKGVNGNVGIGTTTPVNTLQVGDGSKASFNVSGNAGKTDWTRSYTVSNTSISPLLDPTGTALKKGGAYRFTGHIFSTGTDQSSKAVFWNKNNTWYVNVTSQSGTAGNHIHFLVHNGVPSVKTSHLNGYIVSVWHERINLNENAGTDNTRHYFGADAYMSQIGENILMNYGKVGIGTTSPQEKLQIGSNGFTFHDGGHKVLTFNPNTTNYGAIRYDVQNKRFSIETVIDGNYKSHMLLNSKGNVAIYGKLESKEVKVTLTPTADFVFEKNYNLPTLDFIEKYIKEKKHLPEIASAKEMKQNGVNIGEFQIQLLQKIEELTLYTIQQQKDLEAQQEQLEVQQKQNRTTETRLKALEALLQAD